MNTAELLDRLQRHYIKPGQQLPGGIFLREVVGNPPRLHGGCDAIYVGFTSTSGRILVGHELKVSRSDWLHELNQPGKADGWADECHQFWLVTAEAGIVRDGELPHGWGLMTPGTSKTRMQINVKAETKADHTPSWWAVRSIMARQDTLRSAAIANARKAATDGIDARVEALVEDRVQRQLRKEPAADELRRRLKLLEKALGIDVHYPDTSMYGGVKLDDLADVAQAAKCYGSLKQAIRMLTRNYEITSIRRSVDAVSQNIAAFAALADQPDTPPAP